MLRSLFSDRSIAGAVPWVVSSRIVAALLGIASTTVLARGLGPAGVGIVNGMSVVALAVVTAASLGAGQGAFYFTSREEADQGVALTTLTLLSAVASAVALLATAVGGTWVLSAGGAGFTRFHAVAGAAMGAAGLAALFYSELLRARGLSHLASLVPVAAQLVGVSATVVVVALKGGVRAVTIALVVQAALAPVLLLAGIRAAGTRWAAPSWPDLRRFVRFGWTIYLSGVVLLVLTRFNHVLVLSRVDAAALGEYSVAVLLAEMLWIIDLPLVGAAHYHVTSRPRPEALELVNRLTRFVTAALLAAGIALALLGPPLITAVLGPAFRQAGTLLRLYLPAVVLWGIVRCVSQYASLQLARNDVVLAVNAAVGVLHVGLGLWWIDRWGLAGAALATSVSHLVSAVAFVTYHLRVSSSRLADLFVLRREDVTLMLYPYRDRLRGRARRGRTTRDPPP